jgi:hypothetical protein
MPYYLYRIISYHPLIDDKPAPLIIVTISFTADDDDENTNLPLWGKVLDDNRFVLPNDS